MSFATTPPVVAVIAIKRMPHAYGDRYLQIRYSSSKTNYFERTFHKETGW